MYLLIDAGNTRIKLGWIRPDTGEREAAPVAVGLNDSDGLADFLRRLPTTPFRVLGVNVAGERVAQSLTAALHSVFGAACAIQWLSSSEQAHGVRNAYQPASQLGADRWMAMVGLAHRPSEAEAGTGAGPGPRAGVGVARTDDGRCVILATFGTATTIDTLQQTQDGGHASFAFLGGLIFPGPDLMRASLANGTAHLPQAEGEAAVYPTSTHQAIMTGIAAAQAGAVMRQWLAGLDKAGRPPTLYVAGGGWPLVKDEMQRLYISMQQNAGLRPAPLHWLAAPVLDGLACFAGSMKS